jgi:hypothetical protein
MADSNLYNNENLLGANPAQLAPVSPIINNDNKGITSGVGTEATPIFDVNKMVLATQQYLAMNAVANAMFGYYFKWFRAVP